MQDCRNCFSTGGLISPSWRMRTNDRSDSYVIIFLIFFNAWMWKSIVLRLTEMHFRMNVEWRFCIRRPTRAYADWSQNLHGDMKTRRRDRRTLYGAAYGELAYIIARTGWHCNPLSNAGFDLPVTGILTRDKHLVVFLVCIQTSSLWCFPRDIYKLQGKRIET